MLDETVIYELTRLNNLSTIDPFFMILYFNISRNPKGCLKMSRVKKVWLFVFRDLASLGEALQEWAAKGKA